MQGSLEGTIYCIDTSSLIKLNSFPPSVFKTLWSNMAELSAKGRLVASDQVFDEVMAKEGAEDEIMKWAKKNKKMFEKADEKVIEAVRAIIVKFPSFVDVNKETPEADPFIIALAHKMRATVVSEETENK
ncbi:MAG: DUF4411 family protein, partial [Candidatus Micrarchaeota archaeon]|nr:DUF4411 family protein [Candidatus Micrarchaeota archaeon]